ncbi:MAG: T9SS type A sorting domain-containing protein, partial [Bacteroidia bacterium]|nr:T9SS type A sorting domain-containing protein [Bacteroidia bacterium]
GTWERVEYESSVVVWPGEEPDVHFIRGNFKFDDTWFKVYDARGRLVGSSFSKITDYVFKFFTDHLAGGIYFVTYHTNGEKGAKKFEVVK